MLKPLRVYAYLSEYVVRSMFSFHKLSCVSSVGWLVRWLEVEYFAHLMLLLLGSCCIDVQMLNC